MYEKLCRIFILLIVLILYVYTLDNIWHPKPFFRNSLIKPILRQEPSWFMEKLRIIIRKRLFP